MLEGGGIARRAGHDDTNYEGYEGMNYVRMAASESVHFSFSGVLHVGNTGFPLDLLRAQVNNGLAVVQLP